MSVSSVIQKITPWLATAAGIAMPGAAPLINLAAKALSTGLNTEVKADPQSIETAITNAMGTPEQIAALRKIDDDFAIQMRALGIQEVTDLAKIYADDVASARQMQVATRSKTPAMLAWAAVITLFGCVYLLAFHPLPDTGHDAILLLLGAVTATYKDVYGYFFGSSAGSDAKTAIMANEKINGGK